MRVDFVARFLFQKALHHPTTRERVFQMQFVDPAHQCQIGSRNRAGGVVERPPADAQRLGLFRQRQGILTVNRRFALPRGPATANRAHRPLRSAPGSVGDLCQFITVAGHMARGYPSASATCRGRQIASCVTCATARSLFASTRASIVTMRWPLRSILVVMRPRAVSASPCRASP